MDLAPSSHGGGLLARVMLLAVVAGSAACASANDNESRMLAQMGHDIDQNTGNWGTLGADGSRDPGLGTSMGTSAPPPSSAPLPPSAPPPPRFVSSPTTPPPPLAPLVPPTEPPPGMIATPVLPVVRVQPADEADDAPLRLTNADLAKLSSGAVAKPAGGKAEGKPKAQKASVSDADATDR